VSAGFGAWTVLQPAFLLSNLVAPVSPGYFRELASQHVVRSAYRPDTEIAITDPVDLGKFAVAAFLTPKGAMLEWENRAGGVSRDANDGGDCAGDGGSWWKRGQDGVC
jgi:hypothetical protein